MTTSNDGGSSTVEAARAIIGADLREKGDTVALRACVCDCGTNLFAKFMHAQW